jgi:hypothetical protein
MTERLDKALAMNEALAHRVTDLEAAVIALSRKRTEDKDGHRTQG